MAVAIGCDIQAVLNEGGGLWIFGAAARTTLQLPACGAACLGGADAKTHPFANEALATVSAASGFACCTTDSGAVWVWGHNSRGQLGLGHDAEQARFARWHPAACGAAVAAVACGNDFLLALTQTGQVWSCGAGDCGQLGHGTLDDRRSPTLVAALGHIAFVAAAENSAAGVGADGRVWTWGQKIQVALHDDGDIYPTPQCLGAEAFGGRRAVLVAVGATHSAAVTQDGALWTWGSGCCGQLGHGDDDSQPAPARVLTGLQGLRVWTVSCGPEHTLVVTEDGGVSAMGRNAQGCLGFAADGDCVVATRIDPAAFGGARMVSVTAGAACSTAVCEDGCLYGWGDDVLGLLPPGTEARAGVCARAAVTDLPGGRVGRAARLPRGHALAFAMGSHKSMPSPLPVPPEIVQKITRLCAIPHGGYSALAEGMRRLVLADPAGGR